MTHFKGLQFEFQEQTTNKKPTTHLSKVDYSLVKYLIYNVEMFKCSSFDGSGCEEPTLDLNKLDTNEHIRP